MIGRGQPVEFCLRDLRLFGRGRSVRGRDTLEARVIPERGQGIGHAERIGLGERHARGTMENS